MDRYRHSKAYPQQNNSAGMKWLIVISLLILGAAYCLPLFAMPGIHKVDDTTFHVGRLVGLSNVFASPVNFGSFGKNGLMVNIFYPWLTMYPMQLLYMLTGSYVLAYKLYYVLLSVVTIFISYWSMLKMSKNRAAAYVFALLYTFSSYRFADVFNRAALGESIALAFLPLVLLGIYKVCFENYREWRPLAAGMTLIAYSHMLSLVMSAAFTGILFIAGLITQDSRGKRIAAMVKAACLSVALSAAALLPMVEQMLRNDLFTPTADGSIMSKSAYSLEEIIKFTLTNNAAGRGVGLLSAIAIAAALLLLIKRIVAARGLPEAGDRLAVWLILIGAAMFVCTSDMLPWNYLGDSTPLSTIQFVWRMNAYPTLALAGAFSLLLSKAMKSGGRNAIILMAAVTLLAGLQYGSLYVQNAAIVSHDYIMEDEVAAWPSGNVDYAPYKAWEYREDHPGSMENMIIDGKESAKSPDILKNGSVYSQDLGGSDADRTADIPVFRFRGERVLLNGQPAEAEMSERGTTLVSVPASDSAVITISYAYTLPARAAWAFSAVIFLISLVFAIRSRKERI